MPGIKRIGYAHDGWGLTEQPLSMAEMLHPNRKARRRIAVLLAKGGRLPPVVEAVYSYQEHTRRKGGRK
jgi:hypothetical protein